MDQLRQKILFTGCIEFEDRSQFWSGSHVTFVIIFITALIIRMTMLINIVTALIIPMAVLTISMTLLIIPMTSLIILMTSLIINFYFWGQKVRTVAAADKAQCLPAETTKLCQTSSSSSTPTSSTLKILHQIWKIVNRQKYKSCFHPLFEGLCCITGWGVCVLYLVLCGWCISWWMLR